MRLALLFVAAACSHETDASKLDAKIDKLTERLANLEADTVMRYTGPGIVSDGNVWWCLAFDPWRATGGSEKLTGWTTCMRTRKACIGMNTGSCVPVASAWCIKERPDESCYFASDFCESVASQKHETCQRTLP